jgi:Arc/MetJ-type ribon-helix-helix transcriptional regulator
MPTLAGLADAMLTHLRNVSDAAESLPFPQDVIDEVRNVLERNQKLTEEQRFDFEQLLYIPVRKGRNAGGPMCFRVSIYICIHALEENPGSIWSNTNNMQNQKFDHALVLKMTSEMRDDIDRALILIQDTRIRSRSEFIRAACQCLLDCLAKDWGGGPVSVEERKARVLAGGDELDTVPSERNPAESGKDYHRPRCA